MLLELRNKNKVRVLAFSLLMACSTMFLSSCAWWERQKNTSTTTRGPEECHAGNSPFIVNQITSTPNDDPVTIVSGEDGLPQNFTLNLKACLRDLIRQDTPIQNAPFVVEYYSSAENARQDIKEKISVTSDTQGCIQWQEKYKYKYTVKPLWIGLERTIKKESGAYAGAETIPMAVSPWLSPQDKSNGLPSILDIRCEYSRANHVLNQKENFDAKGLEYLDEMKNEDRPLLWVPEVSMQIREISQSTSLSRESISANLSVNQIRELLRPYQQTCEKTGDQENCYRRTLRMILYIPLNLRTLDMSGLTERDLNGGSYDVEAQLVISPDGDQKNYLLHEKVCVEKKQDVNLNNQALTVSCDLNLSLFNQNALYKLVLRIKPSLDLPFKTFEGVYNLTLNFQNESKSFTIDADYDEDYREILNTKKELEIVESLKIQKDMQPNILFDSQPAEGESTEEGTVLIQNGKIQGVKFYPLHLDGTGHYKLAHIKSGGEDCSEKENVVQRTAGFVGKICLKDVLASQKLNHTSFRVFLEKPREGSIEEIYYDEIVNNNEGVLYQTDNDGCISIPISLKHNLYDRQKYFEVNIHVLSEELNLYGQVRLALSPWQRAFQAFQDAQNLNEKHIRFDTTGVPRPQLIINQFRSINLFPSYGLDKLLNIHLFHRIYLLFQPYVRRPDNLSLGLTDRSRELLRDGYYLVRVLLLRNPQETGNTGNWARVNTIDQQNENRNKKSTGDQISLTGATYITHTDSVVQSKANFINFYLPIYLSTKQFYYIASRNFVAIEIHPANPLKFKYDKDCNVDVENTTWEPYFDHELQNAPYAGAFNVQNWMNWNLLQPVETVNTDEIIEQSETGRKYKHFSFYKNGKEDTESSDKSMPLEVACVNEIYGETEALDIGETLAQHDLSDKKSIFQGADPTEDEVQSCVQSSPPMSLSPEPEDYIKNENRKSDYDVLKSFTKENSLRLIDLSSEESETFLNDLRSSSEKYKSTAKLKLEEKDTDSFISGAVVEDFAGAIENLANIGPLIEANITNICKFNVNFKSFGRISDTCQDDIIDAVLKLLSHTSAEGDVMTFLFDTIKEQELIDSKDQESFEQAIQKCKEDKHSSECYSSVKNHIFQAIDHSFDKTLLERHLLGMTILNLLSDEEREKLLDNIEEYCPVGRFSASTDYESCYHEQLKMTLDNKQSFSIKLSSVSQDLIDYHQLKTRRESSRTAIQEFLKAQGYSEELMESTLFNKLYLSGLIQEGVKEQNKYDPEVLLFTKSMCYFWFDYYIEDYLEKDQMISAYTNYIRKFDYHQVLDSDALPTEEKISFLPSFIEHLLAEGDSKAGCYNDYANCLIIDHCQPRSINVSKNEICPDIKDIKDKTCTATLKEECQKNPSLSLCNDECLRDPTMAGCSGKNLCNTRVQDFCITNNDQAICEKYANRCFANYLPCLRENSDLNVFNANNVINYNRRRTLSRFAPLETCLKNPYEFFKFENKMVVHELSKKNPVYEGGLLKAFVVSANTSIGSYMNWTAQRGRSFSVSAKGNVGADFAGGSGGAGNRARSIITSFLKIGASADMNVGQSISSNESNSSRRALDNRVGEGVYLSIGTSSITVGVKEFKKCLVIKPRPNAFTAHYEGGRAELYEDVWQGPAKDQNFKKIIVSRPGMMICNPTEKRDENSAEQIKESYYYVANQADANNSEFLNLYDLANRPFLMILRGQKEFLKLYHALRLVIEGDEGLIEANGDLNKLPDNMFSHYPFPVDEAIGLSLAVREFNETGFHPGIYDYPDSFNSEPMDVWFSTDGQQSLLMETLENNNIVGEVPIMPKRPVPVQNSFN